MTTTKKTATTTCWNCGREIVELDSEHQLVIEIARTGEGRQQRHVPLCNNCADSFGKE
jgi:5-methylcytosine-specific restriction endonuclease McrA